MYKLRKRAQARGFTLVEMMCALTMAGILSSIAYPGYLQVMHKVRRADALAAVLQVQMAQERYRADRTVYGSLADLRLPATTPSRHYRLAVAASSATGYELHAEAAGAQREDKACRHLKLVVDGLDVRHASGPDQRVGNGPAANRSCWSL